MKQEHNKYLAEVKMFHKVSFIFKLISSIAKTKARNRKAGSGGKYNRDRVNNSN
jgi:hypothetical protein